MAQMRKISLRQKNVIPGIMRCIDSKTHPQFLLTSMSNAIEALNSKITHPKLPEKLVIEKTER